MKLVKAMQCAAWVLSVTLEHQDKKWLWRDMAAQVIPITKHPYFMTRNLMTQLLFFSQWLINKKHSHPMNVLSIKFKKKEEKKTCPWRKYIAMQKFHMTRHGWCQDMAMARLWSKWFQFAGRSKADMRHNIHILSINLNLEKAAMIFQRSNDHTGP